MCPVIQAKLFWKLKEPTKGKVIEQLFFDEQEIQADGQVWLFFVRTICSSQFLTGD